MEETDRLAVLLDGTTRNAILAWLLVAVLGATFVGGVLRGRFEPILFSAAAIVVIVAPGVVYWTPAVMPPWYFVAMTCLPVIWEVVVPLSLATPIVPSLALAALGLLLAIDLHRFTSLRLVPWFAIVLTVLFTLALDGLLNILRWAADVTLGTAYLLDGRTQGAINDAMMVEFGYTTVAGLVAGAMFYWYFRRRARSPDPRVVDRREVRTVEPAVLSDRLDIPARRQNWLARAMQTVLLGIVVYGLWERELGIIVNGGVALGITFIPAILERDYQIAIAPGLGLWVTSAVFLHTIGSWGMYGLIPPWDHLTHTFSATVVAAAGYATIRAIHLHSDDVHFPRWALFGFTIVFVLATGVIWELLEFGIDWIALVLDIDPVLAQHGIDDTIRDMLFNGIGAVIVATWGTIYLSELSESLADHLARRLDG